MISSVMSSLSPDPIPHTKNSEAYRLYTTFVSAPDDLQSIFTRRSSKIACTFVLEEVTHPRPTCKYKLRDVLDDLGLLLLRHREEPFRESDLA